MRVTYYGHSCFRLELPGSAPVRLVFDPFLRDNPHGAIDPAAVPCDLVLCSHAHNDHIADALELARIHGAAIVAPYELAEHFAARGARTIDLMPGGGIDLPWGRIQMTPAVHSSALELPNGENRAMGVPGGYLVRSGGRTVYHAGDTALFGDMALIGRHGLNLALLPIGDHYTMGPDDALQALSLLGARLTVPMHYNTFPPIKADPQDFATRAAQAGHAVKVMIAGEAIEL